MPTDETRSSTDDPTGLPDRVGWEAVLEVEEQRSRRHGGDHALVLVGLAGPVDGHRAAQAAGAITASIRDVDFVALIDHQTFAVLALYCQDIAALVGRLRRSFSAAGLSADTLVDARPAGADLRATWRAMAAEHPSSATLRYVDFVAPASLPLN